MRFCCHARRNLSFVFAVALVVFAASPGLAAAVHVVYGAISATATPLWVAQENGLFRKYGLDADLSHIPTTQAIQTLVAGGIQFSTGSSEILSAALAGGDAVYIAGLSNRFVLSIYGRPGLKSVADLKSKTIAVTQPDGATAVGARVILRREGLDPEKDVKFAYIRENPAILNALREGLVDAAVLSPPTSLQARELGLTLVVDMTKLQIPFVHSALATQRSYARANPDAVKNFLKAVVESMKICREQPAQAQAIITKIHQSD
jgi:NitT/TauT family transport system substrate-binding protein